MKNLQTLDLSGDMIFGVSAIMDLAPAADYDFVYAIKRYRYSKAGGKEYRSHK